MKEVVAGLDAAGAAIPDGLDGKSWLPLVKDEEVKGEKIAWRNELLYEYYWKQTFLQTPTLHALRGDKYKFIRYQGIWDIDELYDLEETNGMNIPLQRDRGGQQNLISRRV